MTRRTDVMHEFHRLCRNDAILVTILFGAFSAAGIIAVANGNPSASVSFIAMPAFLWSLALAIKEHREMRKLKREQA